MELHIRTRGDNKPDPEHDPIRALFYTIHNDIPPSKGQREIVGAIVVDEHSAGDTSRPGVPTKSTPTDEHTLFEKTGITSLDVTYVKTETALLEDFVSKIKR